MASVLISGASVAGPTLAFWLHRLGHEVTVVELSQAVRGGGYPIDLRGVAVDVIERMGLLGPVEAARTGTRLVTFRNGRGRRIAAIDPQLAAGNSGGARAIELPRGDLTRVLYEATRADVEYVFADSITSLDERPDGVHVTFRRSAPRTFDLVVGADGLHSNVRRLVFGPEAGFRHDLGFTYAGFSVPNTYGLRREVVLCNTPGRLASLYAVRDQPELTALLAYAGPPPVADHHDVEGRRAEVQRALAGMGWRVPELLRLLRTADDLYVDTVSQIRMPAWTRGRVALVGDAAYAPSFLTGQGTGLAVVGGYVLAASLAADADPAPAFAAYERELRGFVERNQSLIDSGAGTVLPSTRRELITRNIGLRAMPLLAKLHIGGADRTTDAADSLVLPDIQARSTSR
jgi:2-polyprenyl-6-methoxyphenol hydroxylase-like FAD-dependent oxidoreductase